MKKFATIFFVMLATIIVADELPFGVLQQSAKTPDETIFVRTESFMGYNLDLQVKSENGWNDVDFSSYHNNTIEAEVPFPSTQDSIQILISADSLGLTDEFPIPDSLAFIQDLSFFLGLVPEVENNNISISDLGNAGVDNSNDIDPDLSNALDITTQYSGFSQDRFYVGLENETGEFPLMGGFVGPFYGYFTLITNTEAVTDTVVYAMVNANIPVVLPAGLYKFNGLDLENPLNSIQRIADIEVEEQNGKLLMSCAWDDLTSDPDFGSWPNDINSLGIIPMTAQASLTGDVSFADFGVGAGVNFTQLYLHNEENILPELISPELNMNNQLTITYSDENNNIPIVAEFVTEQNTYPMFPEIPIWTGTSIFSTDHIFNNSANGTIRVTDNNNDWVELDASFVSNDVVEIESKPFKAYPNPFYMNNSRSSISFSFDSNNIEMSELEIYNLLGQKVNSQKVELTKGENQIVWEAKDQKNNSVPAGIYFAKITTKTMSKTTKFMILK